MSDREVYRLARIASVRVGTARMYLRGYWVGGWAKQRLDEARARVGA